MKILSPLSKPEEVKSLIEAGADEFYAGLVTKDWEKRFSYIASANLRHDRVANFHSFEELEGAISTASDCKKPVFLVFNALFYTEKQLPLALKQINRALDAGISKIIVSDLALIQGLKENGIKTEIALSTAFSCFNSAAFPLFKELGINRIVLPRHLSVDEICQLAGPAKKAGLELETFVLNALCPYIDGLCTLQHFGKSSESLKANELACRLPFEVEVISNASEKEKRAAHSKASIWNNSNTTSCGLCALPKFKEAGIASLKIAGRGNPTEKKLADVKALRKALDFLETLSPTDFKKEMHRLFFEANHQTCNFKTCYYATEAML